MSSHTLLTSFYNVSTLEPSEVILLMAGAPPRKTYMWDTAYEARPYLATKRYSDLNIRFGRCRKLLFDVNDYPNRHDKRLCSDASHGELLAWETNSYVLKGSVRLDGWKHPITILVGTSRWMPIKRHIEVCSAFAEAHWKLEDNITPPIVRLEITHSRS